MDKILTEAFDKLKAIEESEDPFCIGAKDDDTEIYREADFDADQKSGYPGDNDFDPEDYEDSEAPDARAEQKVYEIDTEHGDNYAIHFQSDGGQERAFIELNGITVATYTVGGAGSVHPVIKDDGAVLDILTAALKAANGSGS